jgi:hypothetical protein
MNSPLLSNKKVNGFNELERANTKLFAGKPNRKIISDEIDLREWL